MKLTVVYRPERETPIRAGSRFIYNTLVKPGYNSFEGNEALDLERYLETAEGKEAAKKTIFDEVTVSKSSDSPTPKLTVPAKVDNPSPKPSEKKPRTPKPD
ncbi:MAG: hypothetical protein ACRCYP_02175 [Alphaproteobacteria bacterium]